jgi:hypothetical protein
MHNENTKEKPQHNPYSLSQKEKGRPLLLLRRDLNLNNLCHKPNPKRKKLKKVFVFFFFVRITTD